MTAKTRRRYLFFLGLGMFLALDCLVLFGLWRGWSPAARSRRQTDAAVAELTRLSGFTILDSKISEFTDPLGCRLSHKIFLIGMTAPLDESLPQLVGAVQNLGWKQQPEKDAGTISFERRPGELLVLDRIVEGKWLNMWYKTSYPAPLKVTVTSGFGFFGPCYHF
jgi:hypothetical protein